MDSSFARIARKILKKRETLGLSQRQLAQAVGCSQSYICQVEKGKRPISEILAEKLETVLKVKDGSLRTAEFRRGRPPKPPGKRKAAKKARAKPKKRKPKKVSAAKKPLARGKKKVVSRRRPRRVSDSTTE